MEIAGDFNAIFHVFVFPSLLFLYSDDSHEKRSG